MWVIIRPSLAKTKMLNIRLDENKQGNGDSVCKDAVEDALGTLSRRKSNDYSTLTC